MDDFQGQLAQLKQEIELLKDQYNRLEKVIRQAKGKGFRPQQKH